MTPATKVWDGSAWVELGGGAPYVPTLVPIVGEMFWPFPPYFVFTPGTATILDASGEYVAWCFQIPRDGVITDIGFRVGTLTTNPSTFDCRLETIAVTGLPSGTLIATGANGTATVNASNTLFAAALTTPPTVNQGDWVAVVIAWASGNCGIIRESNVGITAYQGGIYGAQNTGSTARFSGVPFPFGIEYQDTGIYEPMTGSCAWGGTIATAYTSSSNPDERGIKMTMPFACQANGMWFAKGTGTGGRTLRLYDSANTVLWSNSTYDPDYANGTNPRIFLRFTDPIDLDKDEVYRLTCEATDATGIQVNELTIPGLQGLYGLPGGSDVEYTSRQNAGSWTDTAASSVAMGLLISGVYQ